jgi:hypothetical protein
MQLERDQYLFGIGLQSGLKVRGLGAQLTALPQTPLPAGEPHLSSSTLALITIQFLFKSTINTNLNPT